MKLSYTDRAIIDLELSIEWYESQQLGLGLTFLDKVEDAIGLILENPEIYPINLSFMRRCVLRKFPF